MYYLRDLIPLPDESDSSDNDDNSNNSKYTTSTDPSVEPSDYASNITMNSDDSDHYIN